MSPERARQILGVPIGASVRDVKRAHHRVVKRCHPDLRPNDADAERMTKEANAAREVLEREARGDRPKARRKPAQPPHDEAEWIRKTWRTPPPPPPRPRPSQVRPGGVWIEGKTGRVLAKWGCVERAERQAVGLYNIHLAKDHRADRVEFTVESGSRTTVTVSHEYSEGEMIRVGCRTASGGRVRADVDLLEVRINAEE